MSRTQRFGWFLSRGFGPHGWGKPYWDWGYNWAEPELYQRSAQDLEQAGFDLIVIEDALSLGTDTTTDLRIRGAYGGPKHDPLTLTPYLLNATSRIGIVPTVNLLSLHPYQAARQFASLQHLSRGRVGINLVTDVGSSRHFGQPVLSHEEAYAKADEWIRAAKQLWHSWQEGALVNDAASGVYADGSRLDASPFTGEYYSFQGPLNAAPYAEEPLLVSPGGSPTGLAFAGAHADVKLAMTDLSIDTIRAQREKVRAAAIAAGRNPDEVSVLFVLKPIVVGSAAEADAIVAESLRPSDAVLHEVAVGISSDLDTDLTGLDLDKPVDPSVFGDHVSQGTQRVLLGKVPTFADATLRELLTNRARLGRLSDGSGVVGTAEELADFIQRAGDEADNDGFLLSGDLHPVTIHKTLDELVPILRRRGILRREYPEGGLRANLAQHRQG